MTCPKLRCDIHSLKDSWKFSREENEKLKEEIKELKELTDGIMEESNTQHILGCNAYEKFIQAMTELNYDEKWIKELKDENEELKAAMDTT